MFKLCEMFDSFTDGDLVENMTIARQIAVQIIIFNNVTFEYNLNQTNET